MIKITQLLSSAALSSLVMLTGAVHTQAATNSALNETGVDQTTAQGCSITISPVSGNDWEFFNVPAGISTVPGSNLQPRAERGLDPSTGGANLQGANLTDGKKVIILKGQCDINSANETTFLQIFNYDSGNADPGIPYLQLKAQKKTGTQWPLTIGGNQICLVNDSLFNFELRTNNKQFRLIISQGGNTIHNQLYNIGASTGRSGITRFRFGAYHRDEPSPYVSGNLRFRSTKSSFITVSTPNTGV